MDSATVIIASWNASSTITRSIASALGQTGVATDVVVVDDASSDDTAAVAECAGARVLRMPTNGGPGAARNMALDAAQTDWLAVLDADDTMEPGRLRALIDLAHAHQADVVLGNFRRVDEHGHPLDPGAFLSGPRYETVRILGLDDYLREDHALSSGKSLGYLKPLISRAFLERHALRYDAAVRNGEDFHLVLDCLAAGARVLFSPAPDYLYTVRRGSISHTMDPAHVGPLIAAGDRFAARHASTLSPEAQRVFASRRVSLDRLRQSEIVMQALKRGHVSAACAALARRPSATGMILSKLWEAGGKRLTPSRNLAGRRRRST